VSNLFRGGELGLTSSPSVIFEVCFSVTTIVHLDNRSRELFTFGYYLLTKLYAPSEYVIFNLRKTLYVFLYSSYIIKQSSFCQYVYANLCTCVSVLQLNLELYLNISE